MAEARNSRVIDPVKIPTITVVEVLGSRAGRFGASWFGFRRLEQSTPSPKEIACDILERFDPGKWFRKKWSP